MIKSVVALFVFAVLLCVWIVNPANFLGVEVADEMAERAAPSADEAPSVVTRGVTDLAVLPSPEAIAGASEVVPLVAEPDAPGVEQAALTSPEARAAQEALLVVDTDLSHVMAGILTELGLENVATPLAEAAAEVDASQVALREQLAETLAGIAAITGDADLARRAAAGDLSRTIVDVVAEALLAGHGDAEIDLAVNRAALAGEVAVPGVLVRADGKVDTLSLLQGILVAVRLTQGGTPEAALGAALAQEGEVYHDVSAENSAAALSLAYYGDPAKARMIIDANTETIGNGSEIATGQRIVIPRF